MIEIERGTFSFSIRSDQFEHYEEIMDQFYAQLMGW